MAANAELLVTACVVESIAILTICVPSQVYTRLCHQFMDANFW